MCCVNDDALTAAAAYLGATPAAKCSDCCQE
jgi:hypothetical protein